MLTNQQVSDQLCAAFEGGSNYWIRRAKLVEPTSWEWESDDPGDHWPQDYPLNPGGAVLIYEVDVKEPVKLDKEALERGQEVMREKYSDHWQDVVDETGDATTGDVFLQCCLFGEVIYD